MVDRCANPNCSKRLHYLRKGRIFTFEIPDLRGPVIISRIARRLEHFWLCGECSRTFVLVQIPEMGVRIVSRPVGYRSWQELNPDDEVPSLWKEAYWKVTASIDVPA